MTYLNISNQELVEEVSKHVVKIRISRELLSAIKESYKADVSVGNMLIIDLDTEKPRNLLDKYLNDFSCGHLFLQTKPEYLALMLAMIDLFGSAKLDSILPKMDFDSKCQVLLPEVEWFVEKDSKTVIQSNVLAYLGSDLKYLSPMHYTLDHDVDPLRVMVSREPKGRLFINCNTTATAIPLIQILDNGFSQLVAKRISVSNKLSYVYGMSDRLLRYPTVNPCRRLSDMLMTEINPAIRDESALSTRTYLTHKSGQLKLALLGSIV